MGDQLLQLPRKKVRNAGVAELVDARALNTRGPEKAVRVQIPPPVPAEWLELVYTTDSKSVERKLVRVQLPPRPSFGNIGFRKNKHFN